MAYRSGSLASSMAVVAVALLATACSSAPESEGGSFQEASAAATADEPCNASCQSTKQAKEKAQTIVGQYEGRTPGNLFRGGSPCTVEVRWISESSPYPRIFVSASEGTSRNGIEVTQDEVLNWDLKTGGTYNYRNDQNVAESMGGGDWSTNHVSLRFEKGNLLEVDAKSESGNVIAFWQPPQSSSVHCVDLQKKK